MIAARALPMGKRGGRPKSVEGEGAPRKPTRSFRLRPDVAELAWWISEATGRASAEMLDPLVRPHLYAEFKLRRETIASMMKDRGLDITEVLGEYGLLALLEDHPKETGKAKGKPA